MGLLFSKRHDFLTYEKSLERIGQVQGKLVLRRARRKTALQTCKQQLLRASLISLLPCLGWVAYRRQGHTYHSSAAAYFTGTALPFLLPIVLYLMSYVIYQLLLLVDRHEEKHLKKLTDAKKKLIKELKDSTNFEKTMALLKKYDPEVQVPAAPAISAQGLRQRNTVNNPKSMGMPGALPQPPGAKATSTLLSSALDSVSTLATNLMGDNPALLEELRRARSTAQKLQEENDALKQQLQQLCHKYDEAPVFLAVSGQSPAKGSATATEQGTSSQEASQTQAAGADPTSSQQSSRVGGQPPAASGSDADGAAAVPAGKEAAAAARSKGAKKEPGSVKG